MKNSLRVAACVPAFNEERTIAKVVLSTSKHVDAVVVIDDGSDDYTATIAEKIGAHVIKHERNQGKGVSLRDGFRWAGRQKYDIVVTLDADGQHEPSEIRKLLQPIIDGKADIVIGSRLRRPSSMPRGRRAAQRFLDSLVKVKVDGIVVDSQSGFRAYTKKAVDSVEVTESGMGAEAEILIKAAKMGLSIREVPVAMKYGVGETAKLNPFIHFSDIISTVVKELIGRRPLRFVGLPGLLLIGFGVYGWLGILATYNFSREFAVGHALVYTTVLLSGIFLTTAAIVLFVIRLMLQEIRGK